MTDTRTTAFEKDSHGGHAEDSRRCRGHTAGVTHSGGGGHGPGTPGRQVSKAGLSVLGE